MYASFLDPYIEMSLNGRLILQEGESNSFKMPVDLVIKHMSPGCSVSHVVEVFDAMKLDEVQQAAEVCSFECQQWSYSE